MQTQNITLDFCNNDYKTITVKQYDKDSRNLLITCTSNGFVYRLDTSTQECNIKMSTPDNRALYKTATINEDGTVLVKFDEDMLHAGGTGKLELQILDSSTKKTLSTMILTVIIVNSVYSDDVIIASAEFSALTEALLNISDTTDKANEVINRVEELESNVENAESERISQENERQLNEEERQNTLTSIVDSNNEIIATEAQRQKNEVIREENESNREDAESERQTNTAIAIANAEEATKKLNDAIEICENVTNVFQSQIGTLSDLSTNSKENLVTAINEVNKKAGNQIIQTTDSTLKNSYAGGIKINEVLGNCEQTQYTGRNLIPYPYYETTHEDNGITFTDNGDGSVTIDGTATGDSQFVFMSRYDDTMTLEAGTYTISGGCPKGGSMSTYRLIVSKNDAEGVASNFGYDLGKGLTFDADGTETAIGVVMFINNGTTVSNLVVRPQLELGSVATDYEPYVGGIPSPNPDYPQEIQSVEVSEIKAHGKNFIPYPYYNTTLTANGLTFTDNGDGTITVNGTAAARTFFNLANWSDGPMILETGNYIFSGCPSGGGSSTYGLGSADHNNMNFVVDWGDGKAFTMDEKNRRGAYIVVSSGATLDNVVFKPMIRRADVDDDAYEPYQESVATLSEAVTLHGINDVKDRIVRKDGALCIERNLAEVVLDGSDEITYKKNDESEDIYLYLAQVSCGINTPCLCDKLSNRSISTLVAKNGNTAENSGISSGNKYENIYVNVGYLMSENTLDAFKAWLTENPLTVVYVPTEPTYESLPVADQIALMSLKTFDTVTYISTDSEVEAVVDVDYAVDKVGSLTLENDNLIETNRILIDTALPYTIEIDDEAQTINFIDR